MRRRVTWGATTHSAAAHAAQLSRDCSGPPQWGQEVLRCRLRRLGPVIFYIFIFGYRLYSVLCVSVQTRAISTRTLASQAKSSSAKCSCRIGFPRAHHQHERQRQRCQMVRGSGADGDFHRTRFAPRKLSSTFQRKQQLKLCLWLAVPVAGLIPPGSRTLRLQVDHGPAPSYALTGARRDANNANS